MNGRKQIIYTTRFPSKHRRSLVIVNISHVHLIMALLSSRVMQRSLQGLAFSLLLEFS